MSGVGWGQVETRVSDHREPGMALAPSFLLPLGTVLLCLGLPKGLCFPTSILLKLGKMSLSDLGVQL